MGDGAIGARVHEEVVTRGGRAEGFAVDGREPSHPPQPQVFAPVGLYAIVVSEQAFQGDVQDVAPVGVTRHLEAVTVAVGFTVPDLDVLGISALRRQVVTINRLLHGKAEHGMAVRHAALQQHPVAVDDIGPGIHAVPQFHVVQVHAGQPPQFHAIGVLTRPLDGEIGQTDIAHRAVDAGEVACGAHGIHAVLSATRDDGLPHARALKRHLVTDGETTAVVVVGGEEDTVAVDVVGASW